MDRAIINRTEKEAEKHEIVRTWTKLLRKLMNCLLILNAAA